MKFGKFDSYSSGVSFIIVFALFVVVFMCGSIKVWGLQQFYTTVFGFFAFDVVWLYLTVLTVALGFSVLLVVKDASFQCLFLVCVSMFSAVCCYSVTHGLLFWVFYELSILSLLYLLFVESPYSERFIAGWYLMGYVTFTSLPMLSALLYFSGLSGSWDISVWMSVPDVFSGYNRVLVVLLGVLFMTKIPLFPFHVWLPIVHAEASSIVSVCLSGYIMKLGLLGIYRFCSLLLTDALLHDLYIVLLLSLTLVFFMSACGELDGKRWLAFLSLSHITIAVIGLFAASYCSNMIGFLYSFGHGVSAGLIFMLLWWCYKLAGTRNWSILKSVFGANVYYRFFVVLSLCTAASLPTSLQFFSEVLILSDLGGKSGLVFLLFCLYLFMGSLIPFFLLGGLLSRHLCVIQVGNNTDAGFLVSFVFLLLTSFVAFLFF